MDAMTYLESQRLIHFACRKWVKSFKASNSGFEYDDLVQEASEVYLKVARNFDTTANVAFSTYLLVSISHRLSALLNKHASFDSVSLSEKVESILEDESENPELQCQASETAENSVNNLSPLARKMEEMLIDPPMFLREEFEAINAKRQLASDKGIDERFAPEINLNFVSYLLDLAGLKHSDTVKAKQEIRSVEVLNER